MTIIDPPILNLAVALGIGLLIGAERERRKGSGPSRSPAGIRTFTVTALVGAISFLVGGQTLLALATAGMMGLIAVAYSRGQQDDPGLTTEIALAATVMLGGLAMQRPALAGGLGVTIAVVLASKAWLHRFVAEVLTEDELHDAMTLAAATLVVLPLVPDRPMGPLRGAQSSRDLDHRHPRDGYRRRWIRRDSDSWHPVRAADSGTRVGLHSKYRHHRRDGRTSRHGEGYAGLGGGRRGAVDGGHDYPDGAGVGRNQRCHAHRADDTARLRRSGCDLVRNDLTVLALRQKLEAAAQKGHAFSLLTAFIFATTLSAILVACAALQDRFGENGIILAAAIAGFADTHSAAVSVASLVGSGKMTASDALLPILAGISTNTISKTVLAGTSGGGLFAVRVIPGLILVVAAAWAGAFYLLAAG